MNSADAVMAAEMLFGDVNGPLSYWGPAVTLAAAQRTAAAGNTVTAGAFLPRIDQMAMAQIRLRGASEHDGFDGSEAACLAVRAA